MWCHEPPPQKSTRLEAYPQTLFCCVNSLQAEISQIVFWSADCSQHFVSGTKWHRLWIICRVVPTEPLDVLEEVWCHLKIWSYDVPSLDTVWGTWCDVTWRLKYQWPDLISVWCLVMACHFTWRRSMPCYTSNYHNAKIYHIFIFYVYACNFSNHI